MIELKDVINLWLTTNKNLNRSWQLTVDVGDVWVLHPKTPKHYKNNARAVMLVDCIKLHHDDDEVFMDKGCHTKIIMAYDKEFFQKLIQWTRAVRRQ